MTEGSESPFGRRKQLGAIYREKNLGKLVTETSPLGAEKAEENGMNLSTTSEGDSQSSRLRRPLGKLLSSDEKEESIDKSDEQANLSKSIESESSTKLPPKLDGQLSSEEEGENNDKGDDQANLSQSNEDKSSTKLSPKLVRLQVDIVKAEAETESAEATSKSNTEAAIALFDKESGFLKRLDPRNNSLTQMHEMKSEMKLGQFSAVSLGDWIYVLNGNRSIFRLKYSHNQAKWERKSNMMKEHGVWPPSTATSDSIYVVGGSEFSFSSSVERYSSVTNKWIRLEDKPQSTSDSSVLASHGYVYCFGGKLNHGNYRNSVQRFHLDSATWEDLPPMNEKRANMGVTEFRGKIYVMGGGNQGNERFDPATKEWTVLKPMRISRRRFRCLSIDGCIYAAGGDRLNKKPEKYDIEKDEWEMVDLNLPCEIKLNILDSVIVTLHDYNPGQ